VGCKERDVLDVWYKTSWATKNHAISPRNVEYVFTTKTHTNFVVNDATGGRKGVSIFILRAILYNIIIRTRAIIVIQAHYDEPTVPNNNDNIKNINIIIINVVYCLSVARVPFISNASCPLADMCR